MLFSCGAAPDSTGGAGKKSVEKAAPSLAQDVAERAVRGYLDKHERKYTVQKMHPVESLANTIVRFHEWIAPKWWQAFDQSFRRVVADATMEEGHTGDVFAGGHWWYCVASPTKGFGLRVEFQSDKGFGRTNKRDEIFIVDEEGVVRGSVPTDDVVMKEPGDVAPAGGNQQDVTSPASTTKYLNGLHNALGGKAAPARSKQ